MAYKTTIFPHGTFSDENKYVAFQGATTNLMDYSNNATSTDLYKYQWDYIHNPEFVLFRGDDEESEAIVENVIVERLNVKPQNLYNKKYLRFVKMGRMKENDPTQSLFFKMEDGSVIREYSVTNQYYETDETERKFEIVLPNTKEPMPFYLDKHKDYLLSDDIAFIGKEVSRIAGTTIARYVLPIEDMYIIFEGEDFDGNDASRLAAGGFLILDVVQAGKIYKLVKGVKSVQKTIIASEIATSQAKKRVVKSTFKNISKEAVVDMSCQFVIRLINECYEHPEYSNEDLFFSAMQQVEIGNAILGGAISTISFNNTEQYSLACAQEFFESFEDGKEVDDETLKDGMLDCAIEVGLTIAFKYGAKTDFMKGFFKQFNDEAKQNIIFSRFKKFTGEHLYNSVEALLKEMLKQ